MKEYLNDVEFLKCLDELNTRVSYARITLLTFGEQTIKEIQGTITAGSLNVNGSAAIRRTINLTMLVPAQGFNITDLNSDISLNKKIKVEIGYKNPLRQYSKYGGIIWFPCGTFIISSANTSRGLSGWTISIAGKDKMALLDGTAGGSFPASITFHEAYIQDDKGNIKVEKPTIFQIIQEAVHHWGGEDLNNIMISDIPNTAKLLVKYVGESPIYFANDYNSFSYDIDEDNYPNGYIYNQDIGYKETDFTYPGELILNAGDTVVTLLDKICNILGNFEYFYDVDGKFVFQQKKNYLNTQSPLLDLSPENYITTYSNTKYKYSLTSLKTSVSLGQSPRYDNIKNDFIVWGKRKTTTGIEIGIRYHLAVDTRPELELALLYMWGIYDKNDVLIRYEFTDSNTPPSSGKLVGSPTNEWREELYRHALLASQSGNQYSAYDAELLAEWRKLFDPTKKDWEKYNGWNPDVKNNPGSLNYWLDFIDTNSAIGNYSVNAIGRRTKVINSSDINSIYNTKVPDIIFLESKPQDKEYIELIKYYNSIGQTYVPLTETLYNKFTTSSTRASAFDKIRELLYIHLTYNTQITLQCLPKYYMEPNNIIYIEDSKSNIIGNYTISQFSLPLTHSGMMSITATEVLTRV